MRHMYTGHHTPFSHGSMYQSMCYLLTLLDDSPSLPWEGGHLFRCRKSSLPKPRASRARLFRKGIEPRRAPSSRDARGTRENVESLNSSARNFGFPNSQLLKQACLQTLLLLAKALGWKSPPYYIRRNSHTKTNTVENIAPHLRYRVEQLVAPELELYTWARDRFEKHLNELGSDFQRELADFREGNARFNVRASRIERIKSPFRRVLRHARKLLTRG